MDDHGGLRWLRCALGQTWQGDGHCEGEATALNLEEAQKRIHQLNADKYLGIEQWRLPTITELASLRQCDHGLTTETFELDVGPEQPPIVLPRWCENETSIPTIDSKRFPNTPLRKFWSGSANESQQIFYAVDFSNAWIGLNEAAQDQHAVRPVADVRH